MLKCFYTPDLKLDLKLQQCRLRPFRAADICHTAALQQLITYRASLPLKINVIAEYLLQYNLNIESELYKSNSLPTFFFRRTINRGVGFSLQIQFFTC